MFLIAYSLHLPRQFPLCCSRIAMRLKEWNSSAAVAEGSSIIALSHPWTFLQGGCGISNTTITPSNERQEIRQEMFILTSTAAWTAAFFLLWGSQRPMTCSPFQGETNPPSDKLQVFWLQSNVRPSVRLPGRTITKETHNCLLRRLAWFIWRFQGAILRFITSAAVVLKTALITNCNTVRFL